MDTHRLTLKFHYAAYKSAQALNERASNDREKIDLKHLARNVQIAFNKFFYFDPNYATKVFLGDTKLQDVLVPSFSNKDGTILIKSTFSHVEQVTLPAYSSTRGASDTAPPAKPPILEEVTDELLEIEEEDPVTEQQDPFLSLEILDARTNFEKQVAKVKDSFHHIKSVLTTSQQNHPTSETTRLDRHFTDEKTAICLSTSGFRFPITEYGCQIQ